MKRSAIYLEWVDSCSWVGWQDIAETREHVPPIIQTIGFLIEETESFLVVSTSVGEDDCADPLTIPKAVIVKRIGVPIP